MTFRLPLIALVFALLVLPRPAHAVKAWKTGFRTPYHHSLSHSRTLDRRGLRSERLSHMPSTGPLRNFNKRGSGLQVYRDQISRRGGGRSPLNVLQRGNYPRSYARAPLSRHAS